MEQQLAAGLGKRKITKLIENDEVKAREIIGKPSLSAGTALGFEPIDEIDGVEETGARSGANTASRYGDRQMGFARSGSADQDDIALLGDEPAAGEIANQVLVDRRAFEDEVTDVLGWRQLGEKRVDIGSNAPASPISQP